MYHDSESRRSRGTGHVEKRGGSSRTRQPATRILSAPDPRLSRSVEYGVAILECYSSVHQELGIAELAELVGISRSTTHRYAITLVELGFLEQNTKRKYRLARHAADAGGVALGEIRKQVSAQGPLEALRKETHHTVSMGVLDGARVIYVHRLLGHRPGQYAADGGLGVGANVPVYCTALGKVLLASISDAERRELLAGLELKRYAPKTIVDRRKLAAELDRVSPREAVVSDEELRAGSRSIAALVPRPHSEHPLAIEVTVPSSTYTVNRLQKEFGPRLKRVAKLISGE
jgi:IclR family pca regulon transcriptional regulator